MSKPQPLTVADLDRLNCQSPNCTHENDPELFLHSRCHIGRGTAVSYDKRTGVLTVRCIVCKKLVVEICLW